MSNNCESQIDCIASPTEVPLGIGSIHSIKAGPFHSYAIADTAIIAWGKTPLRKSQSELKSAGQQKDVIDFKFQQICLAVDDLATGPDHTFAWKQNHVYCWGSNFNYELGLEEEKHYDCQELQIFEQAIKAGYLLQQISCGERHSLAVFKDSGYESKGKKDWKSERVEQRQIWEQKEGSLDGEIKLFGWGESQSHQLTIDTVNIIPYPVLSPCTIHSLQKIYSKSDYNVGISQGNVYTWGCNLFSRLGLALTHKTNQETIVRIPSKVILPQKITSIGIGEYHVVAVAQTGRAYSWGKGNQGQLATGKIETQARPSQVLCEDHIIDASCGEFHTLVLLADGRIKTCGGKNSKVLGHSKYDNGDKNFRCKILCEVEGLEVVGKVTKISSGNSHNIILSEKGKVFAWGDNRVGQCISSWESKQDKERESRITKSKIQQISILQKKASYLPKNLQIQSSIGHDQPANQIDLQKLLQWRVRFQHFQNAKRLEEDALIQQLDFIIGKEKLTNVKCKKL